MNSRLRAMSSWSPRAYGLGSEGEGVGGFRVGVASLASTERNVGTKDELVLDGNRDAEACIGTESLCGQLAGHQRDIARVEKGVEAILSDGVTFQPEIGYGFVEIDLGKETVGGPETIVDETAQGVDALEVGTAEGRLEIERDGTAGRGIGSREQTG